MKIIFLNCEQIIYRSIKEQSFHCVSLSRQLIMKSMTHVTLHNKALWMHWWNH